MRSRLIAAMLVCLGLHASRTAGEAGRASDTHVLPRTILALYDGAVDTPRFSDVHALAEMPLNHLGLVVRYHDIRTGFPTESGLAGVRGVLTWFQDDGMPDPRGYLRWVETLVATGRPLAIVGSLGAFRDEHGTMTPIEEINRVLGLLGWRHDGNWYTTTYRARYDVHDRRFVDFERPLPPVVPPYARVVATAEDAHRVLAVRIEGRAKTESDLVILSPRGAYVAPGFAYFVDRVGTDEFRQWYLNPFEFFRELYRTDELPKPDTATMSGRRIYYSHIDGDGWRNLTRIEPYRTDHVTSAEVVLDEIIRRYADLPVTVGAIGADLDPSEPGADDRAAVARRIYALPHVEAAIHTYTHPLDWEYFDPARRDGAGAAGGRRATPGPDVAFADLDGDPRSYNLRPFSLRSEIDDAAALVNGLTPPGKRATLVQWSGDTQPFEDAIAHARRAGLANINGGDTRFDREFPSSAWVAPLGVRVGRELQVFASNSNENTYTDLWSDRFFGFSYLSRTVKNTGSPRRLKPFNLYYHMYSGERLSSLNAVRVNLDYARSLALAPIETSRFSRIVDGFFAVRFERVGPRAWRVRDRGALQTIRFDGASLEGVDFARSTGVVGQHHELGSLFVALDENDDAPLVALKRIQVADREPVETVPYLVEARWRVFGVTREHDAVRFAAQGYGPGEFVWAWPGSPRVVARWRTESGQSGRVAARASEGVLRLRLPQLTAQRVEVTVQALLEADGS